MLDGSIAGASANVVDLCDVESPPPAAGVLHREPRDEARRRGSASRRIGRGEDLAVRALRPVDLVLSVLAGRLPRRGRGWLAHFGVKPAVECHGSRGAHPRSAAVGAAARLAQRPRRVAVREELRGRARVCKTQASERSFASRPRSCCAPTATFCSRSVPPASRTRATGNFPAASSSRARRRATRSTASSREELGIEVTTREPVARAAIRLSACARRAPFLPRVRMGRRASRPRRPGVRVADAGHATRRAAAAGEHAHPGRARLAAVYGITNAEDSDEDAFLAARLARTRRVDCGWCRSATRRGRSRAA